MAKISRISTQKRKGRYNIFLEKGNKEEYAFSVDEDILIQYALRKGMELDQVTIAALQAKDETNKFYGATINLLSFRMRSEKEIADYLRKKEAIPEQIEDVINRLKREGYLDDQEFAVRFVQSRKHSSSKGPLLLKMELLEKGIKADMIETALQYYTYDEQRQKAQRFVEKKLNGSSKKSLQQNLQTLQGTLLQKGYPGDMIKEVLAEAKQQHHNVDEEKEAVVFQGQKLLQKYRSKAQGYELKQKIKAGLYRKGFQSELIDFFIEEHVDVEEPWD